MFDDNYDDNEQQPVQKPSLDEVISILTQENDDNIPAVVYYGLSDLGDDTIPVFAPVWQQLSAHYKQNLVTALAEASEVNFELNYEPIGFLSLQDAYAGVRTAGISLLWANESLDLLGQLIDLAENDESPDVRATAISEIGRFILLGEYEEIPEHESVRAQDAAIGLLNDEIESIQVRRRALEAISNSSLEFVNEAIEEAYQSDEQSMRVSAIYAMGRSYDERWIETVLREMRSDDPEMRYEAARAAGELEIQEAVALLGKLAVADEREIKLVAIWSLGEIGGSQATRLLTALAEDAEEAEDEDLQEAVEDAIGYASMVGADIDFESGKWN